MYLPERPLLPQFLDENKDICSSIQQYARENLNKLSIEFMSEYLHDVILPKMIKEEYGLEPMDETYEEKTIKLFKNYNLTCISPATTARWLEKPGFKYQKRKKGYYVDGHKKPATIEYQKAFVQRYLTYERRAHHWIQITREESKEFKNKKIIPKDCGYKYTNENGINMVEYHVDCCHLFQDRMNKETKFGGELSVWKDPQEKALSSCLDMMSASSSSTP